MIKYDDSNVNYNERTNKIVRSFPIIHEILSSNINLLKVVLQKLELLRKFPIFNGETCLGKRTYLLVIDLIKKENIFLVIELDPKNKTTALLKAG